LVLSWLLSRSRSAAWDHGILHLPFHPEPFRGPEVATMMLLVRYLAQQAQYPLHLPLFLPGPWPQVAFPSPHSGLLVPMVPLPKQKMSHSDMGVSTLVLGHLIPLVPLALALVIRSLSGVTTLAVLSRSRSTTWDPGLLLLPLLGDVGRGGVGVTEL
jgi:hypothetical protein